MTNYQYNQCIWLVDTLRAGGRLTKHEIDALWAVAPINVEKEKVYPIRSFHRHRETINRLFGLYISCDKMAGNYYYLSNDDDVKEKGLRTRLCNSMAFVNGLADSPELQKRVIFEPHQDGADFLPVILAAMREKKAVRLEFLPQKGLFPVVAVPYCLREFQHQWYLAAKPVMKSKDQEVQVYHLGEVSQLIMTHEAGIMPRWFNGDIFFEAFFEHMVTPSKKVKREKVETPEKETKPVSKKPSKRKEETQPAASEAKAPEQLSLF